MIPYHGTPMSGPRTEIVRFLTGRHALVPFKTQYEIGIVAEVCQSFIFDNSAFSYWMTGGQLDVPAYLAWCYQWHRHPGFDWALIPDIIDGDEAANDALLTEWPRDIRGVPVWHLHESLGRLERLVHEWPIVALGSSGEYKHPGSKTWWSRMEAAMGVACDALGRPYARLHGLRMLAPKIFTRLPFSSADSTNAGVNAGSVKRFGQYVPPTPGQRAEVIANRVEAHNSAAIWDDPWGGI